MLIADSYQNISPKYDQNSSRDFSRRERRRHCCRSRRDDERRSFSKSSRKRAARPGEETATLSSSFNSSDRLSKFADPNMLQVPSTTNVLVCIIVGWYS